MHKMVLAASAQRLKIKLLIVAWMVFISPVALCLSLGDAELKSYLNQPLRVHIPIQQSQAEDWQSRDMLLSLEPADVYTQRGMTYPWSIGRVELDLKQKNNGQYYIEARSQKVVQELLVPMIVNLEWPKGRLQKEYTLLVDVDGVTNISPPVPSIAPEKVAKTDKPQPLQLMVQASNGQTSKTIAIPPSELTPEPNKQESTLSRALPKQEAEETIELLDAVIDTELAAETVEDKLPATSSQAQPEKSDKPESKPRQRVRSGFPNDEAIYQHRVKRGDILSLLAQRYRGDVKLPLHRYIHAINDANAEKHPKGLENLEVGQLIRIPNPERVAGSYSQAKRRLDNPNATTPYRQYTVRYGDSLFLIARAFKPSGIDEQQFMAVLTEENPRILGGNRSRLQPGVVLNIPNTQAAAVEATVTEPITPELTQPANMEQPISSDNKGSSQVTAETKQPVANSTESPVEIEPIATDSADGNIVADNDQSVSNSSKPLGPVLGGVYIEQQNTELMNLGINTLPAAPVLGDGRRINPRLRANLRAIEQYVVTDEANQVYDVIQTQTRLPLLYEQILRTNEQLSELKLEMSALRAENQQLRDELTMAKQERASSRRIQYALLVLLVLLLLAGISAYWLMRQWVKKSMHVQTPYAVDDSPQQQADVASHVGLEQDEVESSGEGLKSKVKDLWQRQFSAQEKETGDYSDYDFSKSNYDYSKNYDVEHLESALKSGKNPFAQEEAVVEVNALRSNVSTVNELIENKEFEAAKALLDSLLTIDSSNFELWQARLNMKLAMGQRAEAEALQKQLLQMFDDPAQNEALRLMLDDGDKSKEPNTSVKSPTSYPEPNADKLYEVRVYLSYGHFDMAKQALDAILAENPDHIETLLLQLEFFGLSELPKDFDTLAQTLEVRAEQMSELEQTTFEKLKKNRASAETEQADVEPEVVADSDDPSEQWALVDDEEPLSLDLDDIEELDELEESSTDLVEAASEEEKEFMAAIQEQMESYTTEDVELSIEEELIPDDLRIPD